MADQVVHQFDQEHFAQALARKAMYPAHKNCPQPHYDWAKGPVCGCGTPLLGPNPPVGGKGEQMGETETYVKVPLPDEPLPGAKLYLPDRGWFKWISTTGWEPIDNPDIEPYWGDPVNRWTPLKKGERVMITGGERFVNLFGTAQGEMMEGTEQVIVDGKDSPWSFSPKYLARVPQEAEPIKMGPGHIMVPGLGVEIPDADAEHELAAGAFTIEDSKQLILAFPFKNVPNTNACRYIFGDEIQRSRLVEWAELFVQKQKDYGDGSDDLGGAGQYAELHRKITKLRRALWEGIELENEPVREVLMDLIGHCFLAMMYVDRPRFQRYPKGNSDK